MSPNRVIQRQGIEGDRILIQLPGVDDPERVKKIIKSTAFLEFKEVMQGPAPDRPSLLAGYAGLPPADGEVMSGNRTGFAGEVLGRSYYLVKKSSIITGRDLRSARRSQDEYGMPNVQFDLVPSAADKFGEYTSSHIGTPMAIVLDGNVMSAPTIRARITDSGVIEGNYSVEEAEDLALILRAGALPATMVYLEERTVGPSLGHDSVVRGVRAAVAGLIAVMLFMLVYYQLSGLNANVALIINMIILMGAMAYFGATLTLPGIAGCDPHHRHGGGRQRADLRTHPRGAEGRQDREVGHRHRLLPRLRHHPGCQSDDPDRGPLPLPVRNRAGQGLRGDPLHRDLRERLHRGLRLSHHLHDHARRSRPGADPEYLRFRMRIIGDTNIPFLSYRKIALSISMHHHPRQGWPTSSSAPASTSASTSWAAPRSPSSSAASPISACFAKAWGISTPGHQRLQRFDEAEKHEILIRVENPEGEEGDFTGPIIELLNRDLNAGLGDAFDLNTQGAQSLTLLLAVEDPDGTGLDEEGGAEHYGPMAEAVLSFRKENGIFTSMDQLDTIDGVSDPARALIKERRVRRRVRPARRRERRTGGGRRSQEQGPGGHRLLAHRHADLHLAAFPACRSASAPWRRSSTMS